MSDPEKSEFENVVESSGANFFKEFFGFVMHNKKWWLLPIVLVMLLLGLLLILGGTGAAPFIYTLF